MRAKADNKLSEGPTCGHKNRERPRAVHYKRQSRSKHNADRQTQAEPKSNQGPKKRNLTTATESATKQHPV
jgi:hypothetical protein